MLITSRPEPFPDDSAELVALYADGALPVREVGFRTRVHSEQLCGLISTGEVPYADLCGEWLIPRRASLSQFWHPPQRPDPAKDLTVTAARRDYGIRPGTWRRLRMESGANPSDRKSALSHAALVGTLVRCTRHRPYHPGCVRTCICPHHPLANHPPMTDGDGLLAALRRCPADRAACGAFLDYAQDDPSRFGAYFDCAVATVPGLTADGVPYAQSGFGPDGAPRVPTALREQVRPFAAALAWLATRAPTARPRKSARASTCARLASAFADEDVAPGLLIAACVHAGYRWGPGRYDCDALLGVAGRLTVECH